MNIFQAHFCLSGLCHLDYLLCYGKVFSTNSTMTTIFAYCTCNIFTKRNIPSEEILCTNSFEPVRALDTMNFCLLLPYQIVYRRS